MGALTKAEIGLALVLAGVVMYAAYRAKQALNGPLDEVRTAASDAITRADQARQNATTSLSDTVYDWFGPDYVDPRGDPNATSSSSDLADVFGVEGAKRTSGTQREAVWNMMGVTRQVGDLDNATNFNSYPDTFVDASARMAKPSFGRLSQPSSPYAT